MTTREKTLDIQLILEVLKASLNGPSDAQLKELARNIAASLAEGAPVLRSTP